MQEHPFGFAGGLLAGIAMAVSSAPIAAQSSDQQGVAAPGPGSSPGGMLASTSPAAASPANVSSAALPSGAGSYLSNFYFIDDGTTDSSLGLVLGGTLCWLQTFDTRPTAEFDVISEIQVCYGFPQNPGLAVPNGTPATACVWEDPTDDGDPSDAQLLVLQATLVQNVDTQVLTSIAIPPVTVRGRFFVGVFLKHNPGRFPASRDINTPSQGRAFFVGTTTLNGIFDPAHLAGVGHTVIFSLDTAGNPPGSLNSVWRLRAVGQAPVVSTYCTAKINSLGCLPQISASGIPQASAFSGFVVAANNVRNQKVGIAIYGTSGATALPFQGGFLCVLSPVLRTAARSSGGSPAPANDCSGRYEIDMNAFARGLYGGAPSPALLVVGTIVKIQWWGRDPGFPPPNNVSLSDAVSYPVLP